MDSSNVMIESCVPAGDTVASEDQIKKQVNTRNPNCKVFPLKRCTQSSSSNVDDVHQDAASRADGDAVNYIHQIKFRCFHSAFTLTRHKVMKRDKDMQTVFPITSRPISSDEPSL